ncbi:MAG: alkaline phosphatase D family protein [Flavobacteriales bacterium]|nr:alkaline phosphatase D family protein [Flavobacteriales bacterium]
MNPLLHFSSKTQWKKMRASSPFVKGVPEGRGIFIRRTVNIRISLFLIISCLFIFVGNAFSQENTEVRNSSSVELDPALQPFYHGVASGDPTSEAVIIWTRVTPDSSFSGPVIVSWEMATDTGMQQVVQSGSLITWPSEDYTVHVDVTGLQPDSYYFYEFSALDACSIRGRTKTAPSGDTDSLRFALVSCANFESGYFNAYAAIKERNDVDAVIHLGDYIYEYPSGEYDPNPLAGRVTDPANEAISLSDYRARFSHYHLDEDLRKLHQQFPFMVIWDDHESANNAWRNGAENHTDGTEGPWPTRKSASMQAYLEWLPMRPKDQLFPEQIFRSVQYGDLCDLFFLDTRLHGRDEQMGTTGTQVNSATRTLLGTDQFEWFTDGLKNSSSQWKVVVQQVMISPLEFGGIAVNEDQWDGYPAERQNIFDTITTHGIENLVVLTGDIHTSWANDIPGPSYNPATGSGAMGVEFVAPGITSPSELTFGASAILAANDHIQYVNLSDHGFIILDIDKDRAQADWYFLSTIDQSNPPALPGASFYTNDGESFLNPSGSISVAHQSSIAQQVPEETRNCFSIVGVDETAQNPVLLSVYPNPITDWFTLQFYLETANSVEIKLIAMDGRTVFSSSLGNKGSGLHNSVIAIDNNLAAGVYVLEMDTGTNVTRTKVLVE